MHSYTAPPFSLAHFPLVLSFVLLYILYMSSCVYIYCIHYTYTWLCVYTPRLSTWNSGARRAHNFLDPMFSPGGMLHRGQDNTAAPARRCRQFATRIAEIKLDRLHRCAAQRAELSLPLSLSLALLKRGIWLIWPRKRVLYIERELFRGRLTVDCTLSLCVLRLNFLHYSGLYSGGSRIKSEVYIESIKNENRAVLSADAVLISPRVHSNKANIYLDKTRAIIIIIL